MREPSQADSDRDSSSRIRPSGQRKGLAGRRLEGLNPPGSENMIVSDSSSASGARISRERKTLFVPRILEILEDAASAGRATTLDLTDICANLAETAYTDYCHMTPDSNWILAEHVAPQIVSMPRQSIAVADPLTSSMANL